MKILIVGSGGREHALAWKLSRDSARPEVFCAPGNAGTSRVATNLPINPEDLDGLCTWAAANTPDLTIIGPEAPLCAGLTDRLNALGLRVFGPNRQAAQLEGSKSFAKEIMRAAGIPTAAARQFSSLDEAHVYIQHVGAPIVIKATGLCAGKGVAICESKEQAREAAESMLVGRIFGQAGAEIIMEECLVGEEASILALIDGEHAVMLASSQDHKRIFDGDQGPNTGGMGAYSPAPVVTDDLWPVIRETVVDPTLRELRKRGIVFKGVLYAGLMMTEEGPKVLEYNVRFGDPEAQAILPRLDGDLLPALMACADGTLHDSLVRWKPDPCVCVVMAAGGYPGPYAGGHVIEGLDAAEALGDVVVFHAGTRRTDAGVVTAGGRVLGVTATGKDLNAAVTRAYAAADRISFKGMQYRKDIAFRALERL